MRALQAGVCEAFRTLEVADDKALRAAVASGAALAELDGETTSHVSKRDADIDAVRKDVQALEVDTAVLKWMGGALVAMVTAVFELFLHRGPRVPARRRAGAVLPGLR